MKDLIERIEAALGPDREIDCRIAHSIDWRHPSERLGGEPESCRTYVQHWLMIKDDEPDFTHPDRCKWSVIPDYSASIDAAMTLVDPRALWAHGNMEEGPFARLCWPQPDGTFGGGYVEANCATVPLSIVCAALKARSDCLARYGEDIFGDGL